MNASNYFESQVQLINKIETYAVSQSEILQNSKFMQKLTNWIKFWQFHAFSTTEVQLMQPNEFYHCFYLQNLEGNQIGLLDFIVRNLTTPNIYRMYIKINYILDPAELKKNFKNISNWMKSQNFIDLISEVCQYFEIKKQLIPYVFIEFPEIPIINEFVSYLKEDEGLQDWVINLYPLDERLSDERGEYFRNTFHIFWNHRNFDPNPSKQLIDQYQMALKIQQKMMNQENDFKDEVFYEFANVIKAWRKHRSYEEEIKSNMANYILEREKIWENGAPSLGSNQESVVQKYLQSLEENIRLLHKYGFRARFFDLNSAVADEIVQCYQYEILMNFIQAFNSQGSIFLDFLNSDGSLKPEVFTLAHIKSSFGGFGGILEYKTSSNQWLLAGIAQGQYRKDPKFYSRQFINSLIMPTQFRGYNLAGLLAILGILTAHEQFDIIFDDATVFNLRTHRLVRRLGFNYYGVIFNPLFSPHPENPTTLTSASIVRNYWLHWNHQKSNFPIFLMFQKLLNERILIPFYQEEDIKLE